MAVDRSPSGMAGATLRPGESMSKSVRKIDNGVIETTSISSDHGYSSSERFVAAGAKAPPTGGNSGCDIRPGAIRKALAGAIKD